MIDHHGFYFGTPAREATTTVTTDWAGDGVVVITVDGNMQFALDRAGADALRLELLHAALAVEDAPVHAARQARDEAARLAWELRTPEAEATALAAYAELERIEAERSSVVRAKLDAQAAAAAAKDQG